jgi:hypothetical protein
MPPSDLTPLFHWNTKQVFLYVQAEYENAEGVSIIPHSFRRAPDVSVRITARKPRAWTLGQVPCPMRSLLACAHIGYRVAAAIGRSSRSSAFAQVRNEVVLWDRIVRRKEDAQVNVLGRNKYVFRELSSSFK